MVSAVAENPNAVATGENGSAPAPKEDFLHLAPIDPNSLTLTENDLATMTDEQIRERLNQIQEMAVRLRKHVKAVQRETKKIETIGSTVGALLTASNAAVRAQYQHNKATERLNAANSEYAAVQSAYLRVNSLETLPEEVTAQLNAGREAMIARLSGPVARVKRTPKNAPASTDTDTDSDSGSDDTEENDSE